MPRGGAARSARVAHNHKVAGSNPAPATKKKPSAKRLGIFSTLREQNSNLRLFLPLAKSRRYRFTLFRSSACWENM